MKNIKYSLFAALFIATLLAVPVLASADNGKRKPLVEHRRDGKRAMPPKVMDNKDFSIMYDIVKGTSFDSGKKNLVRVACISSWFDSRQCARLLSLFSFDSGKLEMLEMLSPRLLERNNYEMILKEFSFSSNKEKAIKLLLGERIGK